MRIFRPCRVASIAILVSGLVARSTPADGQTRAAMSLEQVERLLVARVPSHQIVSTAREACLDFTVDDAAADRLHRAGADDSLLSSLRSACHRTPSLPDLTSDSTEVSARRPLVLPYDPGSAMLRSALVPGFGQFYTKRPLLGIVFLGGWGAALGMAILTREIDVECLDAVAGACPPDRIRGEHVRHPGLVRGSVLAAGVAVLSAIEARSSADRANRHAGSSHAGEESIAPGLLPPSFSLELRWTADRRAAVGLRIRW